ncbi:Primary amine oxidase [Acorus calamus]|uniref:Amine oxidase n=1 Tax=Acorus calamus TaxID=4465 RepID=A0AAV9DR64_ACOCL|nr:Primary amine oxidase [Acorus calamus]
MEDLQIVMSIIQSAGAHEHLGVVQAQSMCDLKPLTLSLRPAPSFESIDTPSVGWAKWDTDGEGDAIQEMYGTLLSENVIGVIHDHYITFRLDMDVDGADNSFVKVHLSKQETAPGESPRKSYLKATREVAKAEKDGRVKLKLYEPSEFHIVNPSKKTRVGNPVGYKVVPVGTAASILDSADPPQVRGVFTNNQNGREDFSATRAKERTLNWLCGLRGIVRSRTRTSWCGIRLDSITSLRQEDYPIMPTVSSSFDLEPVNFFESNPILRAAPNSENDLPVCTVAASA